MATVVNAPPATTHTGSERSRRPFLILCAALTAPFAALVIYALIHSFSWDEGFHIMAARLIKEGKRPYLDFCFPQTPLNAYWNALWLWIFGDSWKAVHVVAAILTAAAVLMAGQFILARFPVRSWRLAAALSVSFLLLFNESVFEFGPISQAYGMCLFLTVAAFRVALIAVERRASLWSLAAGALISGAAVASLLTAPAVLVIFVWLLFYNRAGCRGAKAGAFIAGAIIPFLPVIWLFVQAPYKVYFNIIGYQLFYRRQNWEGAGEQDLDALTSWINSSPALLLGLLAAAGVLFVARASGWERARRAEYYLAGWIALAMGIEIASAHPTFSWYFLLIVPFLAILAGPGIYAVGARLYRPDRPRWPVAVLLVLVLLMWAQIMRDDTDAWTWSDMQELANKVEEVTPRNATLWADEQVYFLTHRPLPEGMEFAPAHKLDMPMSQAAPLHILPAPELARRAQTGFYHTIAACKEEIIKDLHLNDLYRHKADVENCTVFWDWKGTGR